MSVFNNITNLTFFENLDNKGYYMMFLGSPEIAQKRYEQYTRTGRYDEAGKAEPYGYLELNISTPININLPPGIEQNGELFLSYIKGKKVAHHVEIERAQFWGWYKFSEVIDIAKWFNEYNCFEAERQQEHIKTNNSGLQTALFL